MRPKRTIVPTLSLGQNFRLVMTQEGLTFRDVSRKAGVAPDTAYRLVERTPHFVTAQVLKVGKVLGFTERQIRQKVREDRLQVKRPYGRKERVYRLVAEILEIFDSRET